MQGTKNLTEGPIKKQLFNLALPIMGTSFIQMAYSITDMAWVGRLGSEAVAAIGAVGILTWMTTSISYLNKVGSEVSVAQSIGAREEDDAQCLCLPQPDDRPYDFRLLGISAVRPGKSDHQFLQARHRNFRHSSILSQDRGNRVSVHFLGSRLYRNL